LRKTMNQAIKPGPVPPVPGLEKEEPELWNEEDIPSDDDRPGTADDSSAGRRPGGDSFGD
jgi:hypothetical protein